MNKIINTRLLTCLYLLLIFGIATSCEKDEDENSGVVQLLSFGPTGANHGDTLRFIGNNLDKVTAIELTGASVAQSEFKLQNAELILIIIPAAAEKGYVTLKTPQGDIVTKTQLNLGVASTVTSFTPEARPGENITLTGNYLNWVQRITFANDKAVETFVSKSLNQLVVKVPDDAQTGPLILFYGGTDSMEVQTADTLKVILPVGVSFSPNPIMHAANLTITGTNLDLTKKIIFTGAASPVTSFVSQSLNELVVKVPAGTRKGKVIFEAASGVRTTSNLELDVILPWLTTMTPKPVYPGAELTITGTNLDLVKEILFTGVTTPITIFESQSATQIIVKVPGGAHKGKLTFVTALGEKTVSVEELELVRPAVTTMSPNPVDPGGELTITGTNLNLVNSVTIDNAPAVTSFISQSATQIKLKVPMGVLRGKITLGITNSSVIVQSNDVLEITGSVPAPIIALPFYTDAVTSNWTSTGWIGGGWGGNKNFDNTSPVREGSKSIKVDYVGGWGSPFQIGGATISVAPYTTLKMSIFGGPGSNGLKVNLGINGADTPNTITLVEGVWTDYSFPVSSLNSGGTLKEITVKEYNGSGGFTIYLDAIGLN